MSDEPGWEVLHQHHWDTTERLAIPGGWLVRSVWRKRIATGQPDLDGSAIVFVPDSPAVKAVREYQSAGEATEWPETAEALAPKLAVMLDMDAMLNEGASVDAQAEADQVAEVHVEVDRPTERADAQREAGVAGQSPEPHRRAQGKGHR